MAVPSLSDNPLFNLARQIANVYNVAELRRLCSFLDYRDLSQLQQVRLPYDFAEAIVGAFQRRDDLDKLQRHLTEDRPSVDWEPWFAPCRLLDPDPVTILKPPSPYKGLSFYTEADADLFFGRGRLVADLLARLPKPLDPSVERKPSTVNFLPIIGASGSGKSSLVRAGMLPKLRAQGWHVCVIRPDKNPLWSLLATARTTGQSGALGMMLEDGKVNALSLILLDYYKTNTPLLLIVDQFEELFTTLPPKPSETDDAHTKARYEQAQAQRRLFIANLMHAVEATNSGMMTVLITLRADFLNQCADYPQLWEAINRNKPELVLAMQREELTDAICKPAAAQGVAISEQLVTTILRDCGVIQPSDTSEKGILPLLSHALDQMWAHSTGHELTHDNYVAAGRVQGAIAKTAEAVYTELDEDEQAQARRIFLQLTELGEGREDTRRRVPTEALRQALPATPNHRDLLTYLADRRLITTDNDAAEVTHEALIREWQRLRTWLDDNREALRLQRKIAADAQEWQTHRQSSDFLYRGVPLDRAVEWLADNRSEATAAERQFVEAGIDDRNQQIALQEATKRRELEATRQLADANQAVAEKAQALAEAQKDIAHEATMRSARTRRWLGLALFLFAVAAILGFVANGARIGANHAEATSETDRQLAVDAQQTSELNEQLAVDSQATSELDKQLAIDAQATSELDRQFAIDAQATSASEAKRAESEATTAAINLQAAETAEAVAETRRIEAEQERTEAERLAKISLAQSLAALSSNVANDETGNQDEVGTLLAIEAMRLNMAQQGTATWLTDLSLRNLLTTAYQNNVLRGHDSSVLSVAFSPDGNTLASGSYDHTVRLWDLADPNADPLVLRGHDSSVLSVAFSPDG
ncbi:MAG: hypothetical protein ACPG8W_22490, partial [Candidatus Promineifilaceae bacterium]